MENNVARWIRGNWGIAVCSDCNWWKEDIAYEYAVKNINICPNCKARMVVEESMLTGISFSKDGTIYIDIPKEKFENAKRILVTNQSTYECKTFPAKAFGGDSWISVKEELPKIPENKFYADVLAYCNDGTGIVKAYYGVDGDWNYDDYYDVKCVTHWMPLPDDPQEIDND